MPLDFTDDKSALVQVMAWCRQATSHYLSQCWPRSLSPYDVIRPQWVNSLVPGICVCYFIWVIFKHYLSDWYHEHFQWNCPQANATITHWWYVNIGSGNGLVLPGNKPLPEVLNQVLYGITRAQWMKFSAVTFISHYKPNQLIHKTAWFSWAGFEKQLSGCYVTNTSTPFTISAQRAFESSDAKDGIFQLIWSIPYLLMPWRLKSPGHKQAWYWQ